MDDERRRWLRESIGNLRALLLEALQAGMFLSKDATWRSHYNGEILYFADRVFGIERPAILTLAEELTLEIVSNSAECDFRSVVVVGAWLAPNVELGKARSIRGSRIGALEVGEHYWAAFVLEDALLVTHGTPLSWCRLVGEVLNAQMTAPFVQRKVCQNCLTINAYHAPKCIRCGQQMTLTRSLS